MVIQANRWFAVTWYEQSQKTKPACFTQAGFVFQARALAGDALRETISCQIAGGAFRRII